MSSPRRPLARLLLLHGFALAAVASTSAAALIIEVEEASEPFSRADGSGYANDVVRAAYAAVGVPVELRVVPYARCKRDVLAGTVAACFSMSWDAEFTGRLRFADQPLYRVHAELIVPASSKAFTARTPTELTPGLAIGIVNGYEYPAAVLDLAGRGIRLEAVASEDVNLRKLAAGRIAAAVMMVNTDAPASPAAPGPYRVAMRLGTLDSYLGFSTKHADAEPARQQFNEGLRRIETKGQLELLRQQWFGREKMAR